MRLKYWIGLLLIAGAVGYLIWGGLGKSLVYFITPSEYFQDQAKYAGKRIRLGGIVKAGTIRYDPKTLKLEFILTDGVTEVVVHHRGTPPALFKERQGVVVEGKFRGKVFYGDNLLVKHSETYQPPKEGYTPEEVRKLIKEAK